MLQQVSDFELELMKIIWENGGTALYAEIVEKLDSKGMSTTKNTIISLLLRLIEKDRTPEQIHRPRFRGGVPGIPDRNISR